jgi:division protein CdvB (Snf7/Vps24/ESCRT-III family)
VISRVTWLALACLLVASPARAQTAAAIGLTDAEKLERSGKSLEKMKAALKQVLSRVEDARNEKDVVKLNCVNEKLTSLKGLLRVAEQADIALHEATANKDAGADAEFNRVEIAKSKVEVLRGESEQCIGQLAYVVDERTTVEVQQPEGLPVRDVTTFRPPGPPTATPPVVRPRPASPSR